MIEILSRKEINESPLIKEIENRVELNHLRIMVEDVILAQGKDYFNKARIIAKAIETDFLIEKQINKNELILYILTATEL